MSDMTRAALEVLIVEPSHTQARIIRRALEQAGVRHMHEAGNGAEALREAELARPDLVVSALHLPDMTADELVARFHALPRIEYTAFVLISSETRAPQLEPMRQAGAIAILGKPFGESELDRALESALDIADRRRLTLRDAALGQQRVLLVDDMDLSRNHIRRVLESIGLGQFGEARNGIEALAALGEERYDLVVTDYNMPGMDGYTLLQKIRALPEHAAVPVLMVTSESDQERLAAVRRAGVSAICDKPFEPARVRNLVRKVLAAA